MASINQKFHLQRVPILLMLHNSIFNPLSLSLFLSLFLRLSLITTATGRQKTVCLGILLEFYAKIFQILEKQQKAQKTKTTFYLSKY
jgi:hypothetical protein